MKNILKSAFAVVLLALIFIACTDEADRDWTKTEPTFNLKDTSLGANVLYETMKNNPFVLTWDHAATSNYNVVFSATEDFVNKVTLGTSTTNTFITTVGDLNSKLLQAGYSPYASKKVFIRIEAGSEVSNTISFAVTVYPIAGPIVTAPVAGTPLVLSPADPAATAMTVTWNDYSTYGVDVKYLVEVAKKGSTAFTSLGAVTIPNPNSNNLTRSLAVSVKDLNTAALSSGALIGQAYDMDIRITATTTSAGGSIVLKSDVVSFKVTPYQIDYPNFYLVGAASAASWSEVNAIKLHKNDNISEIYTYLQPDQFRFLGQQDWNPLNYSIDDTRTKAENRYFKTVSSNVEFGNEENMKFTGTAGIYKIEINADLGKKSLTVTPTTALWDIPNLYLVGSIQTEAWTPASATPFQSKGNGVFESDPVMIPNGAEFKFIGQQSWGDLDYGNISSAGNTGYLGPKDHNGNIKFDGGGSYYTIKVDLKKGTYQLTKLN
ncbi:SusE domain-containing protein [Epilithonimonas vandammei]|uniref:SusE domain-containing protein n=1 Tax=Epilithonimonas vandammei TaxID=2487072 RepID=UPI0028B01ED7|nr:SusE domain-containing protein [Epilithonimonas vandammei]